MNEQSGESGELTPIAQRPSLKPPSTENAGNTTGTVTPGSEPFLQSDQTKKELFDLRTISRMHDPKGRGETARTVLQARREAKSTRGTVIKNEGRLPQINEEVESLWRLKKQKDTELEQRLKTALVRLKKAVGIGDRKVVELQAEIEAIKSKKEALYVEYDRIEEELPTLRKRQTEIPDARKLLETYYVEQIQSITNEEKRKLLVPEFLANLTTPEYIALWRRLNPYFLSHVTRQGFRDHTGGDIMVRHEAGLEKFNTGFMSILEDDKLLRPPYAALGLRTRSEASVREFLSNWVLQAKNKSEARARLNNLLDYSTASAPKYPDKTAVHFASQRVSNLYYGGETDNEIFFIYPSDVIASQHGFAFSAYERDLTEQPREIKWNDIFVWPHTVDNAGIPIDAGFVFLPETTSVDPDTGSKYASETRIVDGEEQRVLVEDTNLVNSFIAWVKNLSNQSPIKEDLTKHAQESSSYLKQDLERTLTDAFRLEIQKLSFSPDVALSLAYNLLVNLQNQDTLTTERLKEIAKISGAWWKRAENAVPAKEFWENYFAKNPRLRPKHIIYYDGFPTASVYEFLRKNNIGRADTSATDGKLLGFDDNCILKLNMNVDKRSHRGYRELKEAAEKIILDHYRNKRG